MGDLEISFYSGLCATRDNVAECLQKLSANLTSTRRLLDVQLEGELASSELLGDDAYKALLEECGERMEKSKWELTFGQIEAGIMVMIDAACIRQMVAFVSSILGKAAARQTGTIVASVGAAAAHGPCPVGDIVGGVAVIGCTAWTARDIYKATKVLPARLGYALENATRECEQVCWDEVTEVGEKILRSHV